MELNAQIGLSCYHCGEECRESSLQFDQHAFCCQGCKLVYEILSENNLDSYYKYNSAPGISPRVAKADERFGFLDDLEVKGKLLQFSDGLTAVVTFYIPQMHCSSCIWLLENLNTLIPAVTRSQVNFIKRVVTITFQENKLNLRELVSVLSKIGYEPHLDMTDLDGKRVKKKDRSTTYRIGISGFVFGNIMLFSFPEYFSISSSNDPEFSTVFNVLNLFLSIPVLLYCASPFYKSAWKSLTQKFLNIDVPIALGITVMFVRSFIEIVTGTGSGYLDTMAGLVFFMLIGRAFQDKTYKTISFERDYKSFFPISVMGKRKNTNKEISIPISSLMPEDHIVIRNQELIPADAILLSNKAHIDYSFVTGESALQGRIKGELIYAGGRQVGEAIELKVLHEVSQSYLTQLWNQDAFEEKDSRQSFQNLVNSISHYFTIVIVAISILGWCYWLFNHDSAKAWAAFTSVLIIACPCALAISSPFTLGNVIRIFGRLKFYLKNVAVIEKLAKVDTVVFDKTGTLTHRDSASIVFYGDPLSEEEGSMIFSTVKHSTHPLSKILYCDLADKSFTYPLSHFEEHPGAGLEAIVNDVMVKLGSQKFVGKGSAESEINKTRIYISFNNRPRGYFELKNSYRPSVVNLIKQLRDNNLSLELLSGDNEGEKEYLISLFGKDASLKFNQSPMDKLMAIRELQKRGKNVLMVGDGLNDAGALKQSDVGISVSDDINNFSPASDAILSSDNLSYLNKFISMSVLSRKIIIISFCISLLYNLVGLSYALQGTLSPLVAAILMPISSVSIIVFTSSITNIIAKRRMNDLH